LLYCCQLGYFIASPGYFHSSIAGKLLTIAINRKSICFYKLIKFPLLLVFFLKLCKFANKNKFIWFSVRNSDNFL